MKLKIVPRSSISLFASPVPYESKEVRKTIVFQYMKNDDGSSVITQVCLEDYMKDVAKLLYTDVTLSNLVEKGVSSHALDMIDTQRLGVDAGVEQLANYIINHSDLYVQSSKSE